MRIAYGTGSVMPLYGPPDALRMKLSTLTSAFSPVVTPPAVCSVEHLVRADPAGHAEQRQLLDRPGGAQPPAVQRPRHPCQAVEVE